MRTFIIVVILIAAFLGMAYLVREFGWKGAVAWIVAAFGAVIAWFKDLIPSPDGWF